MTRSRVVVVAPVVPVDDSPHAGGSYLQTLVRTVRQHADVTVVVPNTPATRAAGGAPGAPDHLLIADLDRPRGLVRRAGRRIVAVLHAWLLRVDPGAPSLSLALAMLRPGPVHDAVTQADVVDLQWSESIRLARLLRRLNPNARLVGTFHDVQSQLFSRKASASSGRAVRWRLAAAQSRLHERRAVAALDEVAVFSDKDADLLGRPPGVRVVHPPLATGRDPSLGPPSGPPTGPPVGVFVAYLARPENDDAARWLLHDVWPTVRDAVPEVRLRLVGRGASAGLLSELATYSGVVAPGFVDDLGAEYGAASVAVVPLRQGAGVKFKTVEALLHGVPVVTTPVGAEGIDGPDLFAAVTDEPGAFASAVVHVLTDPQPARERARAAQSWAAAAYSSETFADTIAEHYGMPRRSLSPEHRVED